MSKVSGGTALLCSLACPKKRNNGVWELLHIPKCVFLYIEYTLLFLELLYLKWQDARGYHNQWELQTLTYENSIKYFTEIVMQMSSYSIHK